MNDSETEKKPFRLDLPPDLHRKVRIAAAHQGVSMATCMIRYVKSGVESELEIIRNSQ